MPLKREMFEKLTIDELFDLLNPDFNISRTYFKEPEKKFMIIHNYNLIFEVNEGTPKDDWELFGYELELISMAGKPPVFGSTPEDCMLNFFEKHPKLILRGIDKFDNNSKKS